MKWLTSILSGGIVQSVEKVALEAIQTDTEKAEAKSLYIKTLDPNGIMRRDTMRFVCRVYGLYLVVALTLILTSHFGIGDAEAAKSSLEAITATFLPITGLFGTLATASFGVNATNSLKGK